MGLDPYLDPGCFSWVGFGLDLDPVLLDVRIQIRLFNRSSDPVSTSAGSEPLLLATMFKLVRTNSLTVMQSYGSHTS